MEIIYYEHSENGFQIFDFRPLINFGGGTYLENHFFSASINQPDLRQMIMNIQNSYGLPRLYLFCTTCIGSPLYAFVEQPVVRCPLCSRISLYNLLDLIVNYLWEVMKACLSEPSSFFIFSSMVTKWSLSSHAAAIMQKIFQVSTTTLRLQLQPHLSAIICKYQRLWCNHHHNCNHII